MTGTNRSARYRVAGEHERELVLVTVGVAGPERRHGANEILSTAAGAPGGDERNVTSIGCRSRAAGGAEMW